MTSDVMVRYLRDLGHCLEAFRKTHRFILNIDGLKAHVNRKVLRAVSSMDLWICVIPGKLA